MDAPDQRRAKTARLLQYMCEYTCVQEAGYGYVYARGGEQYVCVSFFCA